MNSERRSPTRIPWALACLIVPLLGGCDPYQRPDTWSLPPDNLGANDTNLRAMVVNPGDLTAPRGDEDTSLGAMSTRPVTRLYSGRRAVLPNGSTTQIGGGGGQQGSTPSGGGGGSLGTGPTD
jgi:hypothetical protein